MKESRIVYQKAFDFVPHSRVEKSIEFEGMKRKLLDFLNV